MAESEHKYTIGLCRTDGSSLGRIGVDVDWEPVVECARFEGIRQGLLPSCGGAVDALIEPVWHAQAGEPFIAGLRVTLTPGEGPVVRSEVPLTFFRPYAQEATVSLVEQKVLEPGEHFEYYVVAMACEPQPAAEAAAGGISVETVRPALELRPGVLSEYLERSEPDGPEGAGEVPVFIPGHVLSEAAALTEQAGSFETGGLLVGHLRHDAAVRELFVEVTCQVPAEHTRSDLTHLTFTPDTWSAGRSAIALRRRGEVIVGWWHSHSYLKETCKGCDKKDDGSCKASATFFSAEDCAMHRLCFPAAHSVGLVLADSPCTGMTRALFGWRTGQIVSRGFQVLCEAGDRSAQEAGCNAAE